MSIAVDSVTFPTVPLDDLPTKTITETTLNNNDDDDNDNDDNDNLDEFVEEADQPTPVLQPMVNETALETLANVLTRCQMFSRFPQLDYLLQSINEDEKLKSQLAQFPRSEVASSQFSAAEIEYCLNNCRFLHGDITRLSVDAIVNSCHPNREQGEGLDYAIHAAAGDDLRLAMLNSTIVRNGREHLTNEDAGALLMPSDCCVTNGFALHVKKIIHVCCPSFLLPDARQLLESTYDNVLNVFGNELNECASIALPCLAVGVRGFDAVVGCEVAMQSVFRWQAKRMQSGVPVKRVVFVVYDIAGEVVFNRLLPHFLMK